MTFFQGHFVQSDNSQNLDYVVRIASAVAYVTLKISSNAFGLKLTISLVSDGLPIVHISNHAKSTKQRYSFFTKYTLLV